MLFWNRWNQESAGRVYFNISREKPAHTPDTPHVQPLSCKLEWTNQKHFYCFLLKPIRDNLAPGFPRALDLSPLHAQKSSGSRLTRTFKHGGSPQRGNSSFYFLFIYLFIYLFNECRDLSVFLSDFKMSSYFLSLEQKYRLISSVENKTIASEQILVIILAL